MVKQTVCARRSLMTNNSIKYLQRNGIGNIERDKKWRRKEIKSTEMKWNEMLQLILYVHLCTTEPSHSTVKIHNDSINEFHRLDEMEFMSIEWEIVTDVLVRFLVFYCQSASQSVIESVSQCGVTVDIVIRNTQLCCQKCSSTLCTLYVHCTNNFVNCFLLLTCDL